MIVTCKDLIFVKTKIIIYWLEDCVNKEFVLDLNIFLIINHLLLL